MDDIESNEQVVKNKKDLSDELSDEPLDRADAHYDGVSCANLTEWCRVT